eukprot:gnl/Dysnectes_brevis/3360_a4228_980.p1 GENE.gnl/Dysnectes_brevis/3360_a4228_980~~gnl/Dysnectes_brevis/3360_a4228_980.p1  ORF type:complete len:462 (+),score=73.10 gnl/Dysnectes_brevis/3360_a4228_980:55-1440(+)
MSALNTIQDFIGDDSEFPLYEKCDEKTLIMEIEQWSEVLKKDRTLLENPDMSSYQGKLEGKLHYHIDTASRLSVSLLQLVKSHLSHRMQLEHTSKQLHSAVSQFDMQGSELGSAQSIIEALSGQLDQQAQLASQRQQQVTRGYWSLQSSHEALKIRGDQLSAQLKTTQHYLSSMTDSKKEMEGKLRCEIAECKEELRVANQAVADALTREHVAKTQRKKAEAARQEAEAAKLDAQTRHRQYAKVAEAQLARMKRQLAHARQAQAEIEADVANLGDFDGLSSSPSMARSLSRSGTQLRIQFLPSGMSGGAGDQSPVAAGRSSPRSSSPAHPQLTARALREAGLGAGTALPVVTLSTASTSSVWSRASSQRVEALRDAVATISERSQQRTLSSFGLKSQKRAGGSAMTLNRSPSFSAKARFQVDAPTVNPTASPGSGGEWLPSDLAAKGRSGTSINRLNPVQQ